MSQEKSVVQAVQPFTCMDASQAFSPITSVQSEELWRDALIGFYRAQRAHPSRTPVCCTNPTSFPFEVSPGVHKKWVGVFRSPYIYASSPMGHRRAAGTSDLWHWTVSSIRPGTASRIQIRAPNGSNQIKFGPPVYIKLDIYQVRQNNLDQFLSL